MFHIIVTFGVLASAIHHINLQLIVDGLWEQWADWGDCTLTCEGGKAFRSRTCIPPKYGGSECPGSDQDQQDCNEDPCPSKFIILLCNYHNIVPIALYFMHLDCMVIINILALIST